MTPKVKCDECNGTGKVVAKKRTLSQNNALWKFLQLLSDELNTKGLEVRQVLKPTYEIWWTKDMVKELLWKPFQEAKFGSSSTTDLKKNEQITLIHEDLMRNLGEKFGIDYIDFPSKCQTCHHLHCVCN